jgi:hypothetical protein
MQLDADHGDVVGAHLVQQPHAVAFVHHGAARVEGVLEVAGEVADGLAGQELEHAVGADDDEAVARLQRPVEHLRRCDDAEALCHAVADGAREGRAGVVAGRVPDARRVALAVHLLAHVHALALLPLRLAGLRLQPLQLRHGEHARAHGLDALALVLAEGRVVLGESARQQHQVEKLEGGRGWS